jgi:hypothetical protein
MAEKSGLTAKERKALSRMVRAINGLAAKLHRVDMQLRKLQSDMEVLTSTVNYLDCIEKEG